MSIEDNLLKLVSSFCDDAIDITPTGNHHLKRHYVFSINKGSKEYIVKLYYKPGKYQREVSALSLLKDQDIRIPSLLDNGTYDGIEWISYERTEGKVLSEIKNSIAHSDLLKIYEKLGEEVGKMHEYKLYKNFGNLDIEGDFEIKFNTVKEYMNFMYQILVNSLGNDQHEDISLITKALDFISKEIECMDAEYGVMTHNDVSDRNILVENNSFRMLIDFEQSTIHDKYRELTMIEYYLKEYFPSFLNGYVKYSKFIEEEYMSKRKLYLAFYALQIISWAKPVNIEHYNEGVNILKMPLLSEVKKFVNCKG